MAFGIYCSACFQQPTAGNNNFAFTDCGHLFCQSCLQKGKKDECIICKAPCRKLFLSNQKQMNPDIRALFTSIDALCKQYSKEVSRIYEFQEKQRRRFLKFCEGKIAKLNKSLNVMHQRQQPESTSMGPPSSAKVLKPSNTVLDPSQSRSAAHHSLSSLSSDICSRRASPKDLSTKSAAGEHKLSSPMFYASQSRPGSHQSASVSSEVCSRRESPKDLSMPSPASEYKLSSPMFYTSQSRPGSHQSLSSVSSEASTRTPKSLSLMSSPYELKLQNLKLYSSQSRPKTHLSSSSLLSDMEEKMDVDPNPSQKRTTPTGPARISLISPPQDGRMGSIPYRSFSSLSPGESQSNQGGSVRALQLGTPANAHGHASLRGSEALTSGTGNIWDNAVVRRQVPYQFTPSESQSVSRKPITISSLLQSKPTFCQFSL